MARYEEVRVYAEEDFEDGYADLPEYRPKKPSLTENITARVKPFSNKCCALISKCFKKSLNSVKNSELLRRIRSFEMYQSLTKIAYRYYFDHILPIALSIQAKLRHFYIFRMKRIVELMSNKSKKICILVKSNLQSTKAFFKKFQHD